MFKRECAALLKRGLSAATLCTLETQLDIVLAEHDDKPATKAQQRKEASKIAVVLSDTARAIGGLNEQTLDAIDVRAHGQTTLILIKLRKELYAHARAARALMSTPPSNRSAVTEERQHIAGAIAQVLQSNGKIDDGLNGDFVVLIAMVLSSLDAGQAPVSRTKARNYARAVLKARGVVPVRGKARGRKGPRS